MDRMRYGSNGMRSRYTWYKGYKEDKVYHKISFAQLDEHGKLLPNTIQEHGFAVKLENSERWEDELHKEEDLRELLCAWKKLSEGPEDLRTLRDNFDQHPGCRFSPTNIEVLRKMLVDDTRVTWTIDPKHISSLVLNLYKGSPFNDHIYDDFRFAQLDKFEVQITSKQWHIHSSTFCCSTVSQFPSRRTRVAGRKLVVANTVFEAVRLGFFTALGARLGDGIEYRLYKDWAGDRVWAVEYLGDYYEDDEEYLEADEEQMLGFGYALQLTGLFSDEQVKCESVDLHLVGGEPEEFEL